MSVDPAELDHARERLRADGACDYLTVEEVAQMARCNQKTVRRAINNGALLAFHTAMKYLIREHDARAWIESRPAFVRASTPRPGPQHSRAGSVARLREIEQRGA